MSEGEQTVVTYPPPGYGPPPGYPPPPGFQPPPPYPPPGYPHPGYGPPRVAPLPPPVVFQPQYGPGYPYPPPRPSGGGGGIWIALACLGVIIVVGALAAAAVSDLEDSDSYAYDTPRYTYTPTPESSAETTTSEPSSTTRPTAPSATRSAVAPPPTRSAAPPTRSAATTTKPAGPQPVVALGDNPLFGDVNTGLNNLRCAAPQWGRSYPAVKAYLEAWNECLNKMWLPNLASRNLPSRAPTLNVIPHGGSQNSPCSGGSSNNYVAFYCSVNEAMYMPFDNLQLDKSNVAIDILVVLAHEYGHHVQALSGISEADHRATRAAGGWNTVQGLEISRRTELQAQCFSGMWLGSSTAAGAFPANIAVATVNNERGRGDDPGEDPDHGSHDNNYAWYNQGYKFNRNFQCNTWKAPANQVS